MHKPAFFAIALTMLILASFFGAVVSADSSVAVKKGDWIRYQVKVTGNPSPEENITWARMDIVGVQGENITVDVQTGFANGTVYPENGITLNLATGAIGDGFFIPTNVNPGDRYSTEYEGIINITGTGQLETGGAQRATILGSAPLTNYYWDKQTGIMVAATSTYPTYTMHTTTSGTNIWQPQPQILGLYPAIFYSLIVVIVVMASVVAVLVWRKKTQRK